MFLPEIAGDARTGLFMEFWQWRVMASPVSLALIVNGVTFPRPAMVAVCCALHLSSHSMSIGFPFVKLLLHLHLPWVRDAVFAVLSH